MGINLKESTEKQYCSKVLKNSKQINFKNRIKTYDEESSIFLQIYYHILNVEKLPKKQLKKKLQLVFLMLPILIQSSF